MKRQRLIGALLAVALWAAAPGRLFEILVGHATWAFMVARCRLAAFSSIFQHIQRGERQGPLQPIPLSPATRWELITAAALLAFAHIALEAPVASSVVATDSSPCGFGVCAASPGCALIAEALRFWELRGEYVSLSGAPARRPGQDARVAAQRPLAAGWEDVQWRTVMAHPWKRAVQQAVGELQTAELGLQWSARNVANY